MCESASISWAHKLSLILTAPLPKISCWKISLKLACGSTENTSTFLPCSASQYPVAAEKVVLPSPPLPPNITYGREVICCESKLTLLAEGVGDVALAQHAALPGADLGDDVREEAQAVVRRQNGHAQ